MNVPPVSELTPAEQPVAWSGAIIGVVVAAIPLLRALNVEISKETEDAIFGFALAVIVLATLIVRQVTTTKARAQAAIDKAYLAQPGDPAPTLDGKNLG